MDACGISRSAEISECGRYRWKLKRRWRLFKESIEIHGHGVCSFVMLNPSTADGTQDDPTVRRCIGFASSWGYDTLVVRNLFALRATSPRELLTAENPTGGSRGDAELLRALTGSLTVVAWGSKVPFDRDKDALQLFKTHFPGVPLFCLGVTKSGSPRHPLYVRADVQPMLWPGLK